MVAVRQSTDEAVRHELDEQRPLVVAVGIAMVGVASAKPKEMPRSVRLAVPCRGMLTGCAAEATGASNERSGRAAVPTTPATATAAWSEKDGLVAVRQARLVVLVQPGSWRHNYVGHNYMGHNYVGHNYVGHKYYT